MPKQIRNATSCGNCLRASVSMECAPLLWESSGRIPKGKTSHVNSASANPQINPAPGLVARLEKNRAKNNPKREPHKIPRENGIASTGADRAPPKAPENKPTSSSAQPLALGCALISAVMAD